MKILTRYILKEIFGPTMLGLLFYTAIFLLTLYLMNTWLPRANAEFMRMRLELATSGAQKEIRPRVFYDDFENVIVYVNDIDPRTGEWRGVFVADTRTEDTATRYGTT